MSGRLAAAGRWFARLPAGWKRSTTTLADLWRRSLQFRVTASTLALSSTVVFVLGMVLQNQITERLIDTKRDAAIAQTNRVVTDAEGQLVGSGGSSDEITDRLDNAIENLTSNSSSSEDSNNSAAGAFQPVLAAGGRDLLSEDTPATDHYSKVPTQLARYVQDGNTATQIDTVDTADGRTTYLIVGKPVSSGAPETNMVRPIQLYLLFPLTSEQQTVATVQNTLLVGSLVLLLLLAAIANLVSRQVVRPVRRAADAAEQFADGDLNKRLPVVGEDDLASLAESYNGMAESIQSQIQQLEEFGRLQRRFTQDVSHELRTPLTTVRMAADVLYASRDEFPSGLARSAELLTNELDQFETLLGHLLEISRHDAGVEELSTETVDLRSMVEAAAEEGRLIAADTDTIVEVDVPEHEVRAEIDKHRIERVLRNLVGNAVDHSEGRPVRVLAAADEHAVAVTVRDYGVGLRKDEAELVFNRFWRADPSRNRRTGGTGLGLAIAHEDVRLHGGTLQAWGESGSGSCFRLTLPRTLHGELPGSPLELPPDPPEHEPDEREEQREAAANADDDVVDDVPAPPAGTEDVLDREALDTGVRRDTGG